jgi:hypothetical protein
VRGTPKWRQDVPIEPPRFLYRNTLVYMGWLLSKIDFTQKERLLASRGEF